MLAQVPFVLAEAAAPARGSFLVEILPFVLMFAVIWLLILRPMRKQEKQRRDRIAALKKGDQVVLSGGIIGRISSWDEPHVGVVEIADKVKVRVMKKDVVDSRDAVMSEADKGGAKDKPDAKPKEGDQAKAEG